MAFEFIATGRVLATRTFGQSDQHGKLKLAVDGQGRNADQEFNCNITFWNHADLVADLSVGQVVSVRGTQMPKAESFVTDEGETRLFVQYSGISIEGSDYTPQSDDEEVPF